MAIKFMRPVLLGALCALGFVTTVSGQTQATYVFATGRRISAANPSTTVEVWATWTDPTHDFVFGGGNFDIIAGDGIFSDPTNILNGPGTTAGIASGNTVTGAAIGQIHFPSLIMFGLTHNPILLATYVWTTSDFTQRYVPLITSNTNNFIVTDVVTGATTQLYPGEFRAGMGGIPIWPTPSTVTVLALGGLVAARRKRCS